jgi:predicted secreted protein
MKTVGKLIIRIILFLFVSSVLLADAQSQGVPKEEWSRTLGGPYGDGFWSLQETEDGGCILVGYTAAKGEGADLWLVRTDREGDPLWNRTFGGSGEDVGYFIQETKDGGYIVTGSTDSFGMGGERLWLLKTDSSGIKEWDRVFGGFVSSSGDGGWAADATEDGGYIVTGYTQSFGEGRKDLWLLKTDGQGKEIWDKTFGGTEDDVGMSVAGTGDGGYIVTGRTASFGAGGDDIWLLKADSLGREEWNTTFGGKNDDAGFQVLEVSDGYALVGRTESGSDDKRIILIKTDREGHKLWERTYKGSAGTSLQPTSDGGFIIAGRIDSEESGKDALLIKTDSSGREQWAVPRKGEGDDIATWAVQSSDGSYLFAGITSSYGSGAEDGWLVKLQAGAAKGEERAVDNTSINFDSNATNATKIQTGKRLSNIEKIFNQREG